MIKKDFLEMIDEEFEDFENERTKRKNLRMMIDFASTEISHEGKEFIITPPKLKTKFKSSVYVKDNKKGNSLF
jgi:hypothetical protein